MILKTVLKKDIKGLTDLDPFSIIKYLDLPGRFCIAAFIDEEDEEPCGIMILSDNGKDLTIEWLCVKEELRGRGIGENLLAGAYRIAAAKGYEKIGAAMPKFAERTDYCPEEEAFLNARYFEEYEDESEWHLKLLSILKKNTVRGILEKCRESDEYFTFSQIPARRRMTVLESLDSEPKTAALYKLSANPERVDGISSVCVINGKLTGAAVFEEKEGNLYLTALYGPVKKQIPFLFAKALDAAGEQYPGDEVHIIIRSGDYEEELTGILGKPVPTGVRYAQTGSFFEEEEIPVDEPDFYEAFGDSLELL
ncbi:MAG: GNAT family N-acetyltransferase [Lachnospiraceae bacterium]|nr:GNAT family N-acetyltransferase [Lachnospiraceae bacterium]